MTIKILVDTSHNERITTFPENILETEEFIFDFTDPTGDLADLNRLSQYQLILLGHPIPREKIKDLLFTQEEIITLKEYVKKGGALLISSGSRGDYDYPADLGSLKVLNTLSGVKRFHYGILMNPMPEYHLEKKYDLLIPKIEENSDSKSVLKLEIKGKPLILSKCTRLELDSDLTPMTVFTSPPHTHFHSYQTKKTTRVDQVPLVVANNYFKGRVLSLATSQIFISDPTVGIKAGANTQLVKNSLSWLLNQKIK
jgi:hypothetical protein